MKSPEYQLVGEETTGHERVKLQSSTLRWLKISVFTLLSLVTGLIVATIACRGRVRLVLMTPELRDCGRTAAEAISRGCIMEPMTYGFMPPECVIPELAAQYTPWENTEWYDNENLTGNPISAEDLQTGKVLTIWTASGSNYHADHCLFLSRKLAYAVTNQMEWTDLKTLSSRHSDHCAMELRNGIEDKKQWVDLGIYRCRRILYA